MMGLTSMIDWLAFRLMAGMEAEERCWRIVPGIEEEGDAYIAHDMHRYHPLAPDAPGDPHNLSFERVVRIGSDAFTELQRYVRFRSVRAGIIGVLQFWKPL